MEIAHRRIEELSSRAELGRHLTIPWRVAIAGPPNVGKSSLLNVLAGFQRSVVAPVPGTTRDVVSVELAIDGWPVEFLDMAGLREANDELERAGVERALAALASVDLVLWLFDATESNPARPVPMVPVGRALTIANKCDLTDSPPEADLLISAKTGAGIPALCDAISRKLVPTPPAAGAAIPIDGAHVDLLRAFEFTLRTEPS